MVELQDMIAIIVYWVQLVTFSLLQFFTYVPPPLKKYKEYSCALATSNIPKDILCELILKNHKNEEVNRSFCRLKRLLKTHGAYTMQREMCDNPAPSNNSIFH